jgi:hypothetical protein
MAAGQYPPACSKYPAEMYKHMEPLYLWLPRLMPPEPMLTSEQREAFCAALIVPQDDSWRRQLAVMVAG